MNLDADDLVLYARVAEAGSFSRASERCGLPKATVSRRIGALEAKLGERLMTRTTRQLAITEFGERILEHARRLLEETEAAGALAQHRQATPQGTLRVSLPPGLIDELELVPFLLEFAERHPDVRLELDISPRRVDVIAERFDLAVRVAPRLPDDATLVARRLIVGHNLEGCDLALKIGDGTSHVDTLRRGADSHESSASGRPESRHRCRTACLGPLAEPTTPPPPTLTPEEQQVSSS